jgi:hypothetical protein
MERTAFIRLLVRVELRVSRKSHAPSRRCQSPPLHCRTLRQLPLVGTGYPDLNRPLAIDEALFDKLTQEEELAKVAEIRNMSSVRILDSPDVPEDESWPLRLWIIFLSTVGSLPLAVAWFWGNVCWQRWHEDAQKLFAVEVFQTIGTHIQLGMKNRWRI